MFELREYLLRKFKTEMSSYKNVDIAIDILVANFDFESWLDGCVQTAAFMIPQKKKPDGSVDRPEPLVWRYSLSPQGHVLTHWKMSLVDQGTEVQDEWGPFEECYVECQNPATGQDGHRRVLRTKADGEKYMLKVPSLLVNPGYEEYLDARSWSQERVLGDMRKVKWPPGTPAMVDAVWATMGDWHRQHQRSADLPTLPVQWQEQHMQGLEMGTGVLDWHEMWTTLLQFSPRAPPHGAAAAAAAAAAAIAAAPPAKHEPIVSQPVPPSARRAAAAGMAPAVAPRASEVNVVRSMAYTSRDASLLDLQEKGEGYVQRHWDTVGALFWVELADLDGELRVGLVRRTQRPPHAKESDGDAVDGDADGDDGVWVEWFERKQKQRREWGKAGLSFKRAVGGGFDPRTRQQLPLKQFLTVTSFLPVVVVTGGRNSSDSEPKVTKLGLDALRSFVGQRPELAEGSGEASSSGSARGSEGKGTSGSGSSEEDGSSDEGSSIGSHSKGEQSDNPSCGGDSSSEGNGGAGVQSRGRGGGVGGEVNIRAEEEGCQERRQARAMAREQRRERDREMRAARSKTGGGTESRARAESVAANSGAAKQQMQRPPDSSGVGGKRRRSPRGR